MSDILLESLLYNKTGFFKGEQYMKEVLIYSTPICPYCVKAKMLLKSKGVPYREIDVSSAVEREKMIERSNGKRTVPQIFIGDYHVGGSDDLHLLEQQGKLDGLLED